MKKSGVKKLLFGMFILFAFTSLSSIAVAGTITFTGAFLGASDAGFNATVSGIPPVPDGAFTTFCIEKSEYISSATSGPYYVVVNTAAVNGGDAAHGGSPDPLNIETAWLYYQFRIGSIVLGTPEQAQAFQAAVWHFEQEAILSVPGSNTYYNQAMSMMSSPDPWTDIGPVRVLNLYADESMTSFKQDVLAVVPIPGAVWLLGSGLLGLAGIRMRSRSKSV